MRSASVSGQRSQWTDLSPRQAGLEGRDEVGDEGGSWKTKEKEPQAVFVVHFGFEIRHSFAKMACCGESLCISYNNNS